MERESLFKDRSFSSIIATAYRVQTDNIGRIIKASWLPVLLTGASFSAMFTLLLPNSAHPSPTWLHIIGALILGLLSTVFSVWSFSRVMSLFNEQPRIWNLKRSAFLVLYLLVIYMAILLIVTVIIFGINLIVGEKAYSFFLSQWWMPILLSLILALLLLPFYYIAMRYMDQRDVFFWKTLIDGYKRGLHYLGFIFLTMFVCGIIMCIILSVVYLPLGILMMANTASFLGVISGDAADMPSYFPFLYWGTAIITFVIAFYVITYEIIVAYLMYGSIEKQEEEKRKTTPLEPVPTQENK